MIDRLSGFQEVWRLAHACAVGAIFLGLASCGEVKVVNKDSLIGNINPLSEIVSVETLDQKVTEIDCLKIGSIKSDSLVTIPDGERDTFRKASIAHLSPLNYLLTEPCNNRFNLIIHEYRVRDLVIASRLEIDLTGEIWSENRKIWSASYRLAENAGSIPFDPISAGIGVMSARHNASEDSRENGVYLAIRRLLRGLPERSLLPKPMLVSQEPKDSDIALPNFDTAVELWKTANASQALEMMERLFVTDKKGTVGYYYGLMLEASGMNERAAKVYADTAIYQVEHTLPEEGLKTLRRLQRLTETDDLRHDYQFSRAVTAIEKLLKR